MEPAESLPALLMNDTPAEVLLIHGNVVAIKEKGRKKKNNKLSFFQKNNGRVVDASI